MRTLSLYRCMDCGARLVSGYEHKQACYHCKGAMEYMGAVSRYLNERRIKF